ncbi:PREDICTED: uncharacterized protein LOC105976416 [Erythranthe guttata]|uniref:uncharacterized protein LOC105976416 n=1 Tax=Erythranthe guttata TaxID=4155 RepID=UPI00064DAFEC|nr:PREDICTED: uncharacterized protein LOC105976416 [Erythranthe guttata]|eukprot:XP_012857139.1 PREDICTED: uncharacterized protein LOC105976416 [Erythranthe guttata]
MTTSTKNSGSTKVSGAQTRAQNAANGPNDQSRTIQDLTALVREQNEQIQLLVNLQNQNPPPPPTQNTAPHAIYERFLRMHPAEFHGGPDPTIAEEWIKSLEVIFDYMEMSNRDRIHCSLFLLKNEARHWWEGTKEGIDLTNTTWSAFKILFFEKYFSKNLRAQKLKEFLELKQGNLSVAEYVRRFEQGCLYAPFISRDADEKANHFLRGLNPVIQRDVRMSSVTTFRKIVDKALEADQAEQVIRQSRSVPPATTHKWKRPHPGPSQNNGKRPMIQNHATPPARPICPKCRKPHFGPCAQGTNNFYRCGKPGHLIRDCPQPPPQNRAPGRVFAMTKDEAEDDPSMIAGTIYVCNNLVYALVDSGSTHSFVSSTLAAKFPITPTTSSELFTIRLPSGNDLESDLFFKDCPIQIQKKPLNSNLIILPIDHFEWNSKGPTHLHSKSSPPSKHLSSPERGIVVIWST